MGAAPLSPTHEVNSFDAVDILRNGAREMNTLEEHHDLHQPCDSVEERENILLVRNLVVSYDDTCNIYGEIAVA